MNQILQPKNTTPILYPYIPKRMIKQLQYQVFKDKSNKAISQWNTFQPSQKEIIVLNDKLKDIGRESILNSLYRFIYKIFKK